MERSLESSSFNQKSVPELLSDIGRSILWLSTRSATSPGETATKPSLLKLSMISSAAREKLSASPTSAVTPNSAAADDAVRNDRHSLIAASIFARLADVA